MCFGFGPWNGVGCRPRRHAVTGVSVGLHQPVPQLNNLLLSGSTQPTAAHPPPLPFAPCAHTSPFTSSPTASPPAHTYQPHFAPNTHTSPNTARSPLMALACARDTSLLLTGRPAVTHSRQMASIFSSLAGSMAPLLLKSNRNLRGQARGSWQHVIPVRQLVADSVHAGDATHSSVSRSDKQHVLCKQLQHCLSSRTPNLRAPSLTHLSGSTMEPFWSTCSPSTSRSAQLRTWVRVWLGTIWPRRS